MSLATPRRSRLLLGLLALAVLAALAAAWTESRPPRELRLSGESEYSTPEFTLAGRRYAVRADLLPGCQYTFYLTPEGQPWHRAGRAIASASGEEQVSLRTDPVAAGRYFVHAFTAPEEGCSWALRLTPL